MSRLVRLLQDSRLLPFADAASGDLPMPRLLRLALFQVSVGMALALLNGTLNRVMIVELKVPAWLVATMVALPLLFAPFRAFLGFRSDHHRSVLGWRRVPYIWMGTLLQYCGLAVMPFALMVLGLSLEPALQAWRIQEASPDPGGLPRFWARSLIPLGFALLSLQGIASALRARARRRELE